jgi:hypothetical protein
MKNKTARIKTNKKRLSSSRQEANKRGVVVEMCIHVQLLGRHMNERQGESKGKRERYWEGSKEGLIY